MSGNIGVRGISDSIGESGNIGERGMNHQKAVIF